MTATLDNTKQFNIISSFTLSSDDVAVMSLLYAPLIGSDAFMLYIAFQSLLERNNLKSETIIHQDFFEIYSLDQKTFLNARYKLEGIGLLITYENDFNLLYVLAPPLTAKNFLKDATLGLYLYSKIRKETFEFIGNHFKIEKIDKQNYKNITKLFDEVYDSRIDNEVVFDKFKYILGKKPNKNITITNSTFNFDSFVKEINKDFLEMGVTQTFKKQIINLAFVYGFDELEMESLFNDSINRAGLYDYRLLKKKANLLFNYKRNMKGPILVSKDVEVVKNDDLVSFLDNSSPIEFLEEAIPNYPSSYLDTIEDIYANIKLPRGVLNCMILKVIKDKSGELPTLAYFKKVSESWIKNNVFSTLDAIKYITNPEEITKKGFNKEPDNGGFDEL